MAVEFAVIGSVFLMLLFLIVDATWAMAVEMAMNDAVQEASRLGSIGNTTLDAIRAKIKAQGAGLLDINNLNVTMQSYGSAYSYGHSGAATTATDSGSGKQLLLYTVTYTQPLLTPPAIALMGQTSLIHSTTILVQNEPF